MNTNRRYFWRLLCSGALIICSGCCTNEVRSEADLFFLKHPDLRHYYERMEPTSLYLLQTDANLQHDRRIQFISTFVEWTGTNATVVTNAKRTREMVDASYREERKWLADLKAIVDKEGGQIYFYQYVTNRYDEEGYALIHDGEIIRKVNVVIGHSSDSDAEK